MKIRNLLGQKLSNIFSNKKTKLKKEKFIPYGKQYISKDDISAVIKILKSNSISSEFRLLCYERGLNEFRKDLRVFDC